VRKRNWASKITNSIGLHSESILGVPVVELCGNDRVLVENVNKVVSFTDQEVLLSVSLGGIRVLGDGLKLDYLGADRVLILGKIFNIGVESSGGFA